MSLALMSQLITILLCIGVIVQATRMMRELKAVTNGDMSAVVTGLDRATLQASAVLADLKRTLGTDGAALAQALADGQELQEELTMLIGIANSMAERLVDAGKTRPGPTIDMDDMSAQPAHFAQPAHSAQPAMSAPSMMAAAHMPVQPVAPVMPDAAFVPPVQPETQEARETREIREMLEPYLREIA